MAGILICFLMGELRMSEGRRKNQWRGEDCVGEVRGAEVKEQDSLPRQRVSHILRRQMREKGKCKWCLGIFYEHTQVLSYLRQSSQTPLSLLPSSSVLESELKERRGPNPFPHILLPMGRNKNLSCSQAALPNMIATSHMCI